MEEDEKEQKRKTLLSANTKKCDDEKNQINFYFEKKTAVCRRSFRTN